MQRTITADIDAPAPRVFAVVADLATYPAWMGLVSKAEPASADSRDEGPAWFVTLRAKVGPFARSKRLRMVRTHTDDRRAATFERREHDGRQHSPWIMEALIAETPTGSSATITLSYGGGLWTGPLEAVLGGQIDAGVPRLQRYVASLGSAGG